MRTQSFTAPAALHPGTPKVHTPFLDAQDATRDDQRRLRRSLTNWQRAHGVQSLLNLVLVGVVVYLVGHVKVMPYVVEVDTAAGSVRTIGLLPQTWRGQTPAVIEQMVRDWLYRMRRVGIDPVMQTEQLTHANAFMTSAAIAMAKPFVQERFELQKKEWTTQIEIGTLLPLTSDFHAVEVEWRERTFNKQGGPVGDERWKGIFNVVMYQPQELKHPREMRNPLGIFISDYSWTTTSTKAGRTTP